MRPARMPALLFACLLPCAFRPGPPDGKKAFLQLCRLEGTWRMITPKGPLYEVWTQTGKKHLEGRSFSVFNGDTVALERVTLAREGNAVVYTPVVNGQNRGKPVSFRLVAAADTIFAFENPQHDFPKRIVYKFMGQDSLYAWIDGGPEWPEKRQDYRYSRMKLRP